MTPTPHATKKVSPRRRIADASVANTVDTDGMSVLERASSSLLRYPRFMRLHQVIRECQSLSKVSREPRCVALEGVTGAGKSTLVEDYTASFVRSDSQDASGLIHAIIPVLYVETPAPVTVKGMAAAMLEALGDPAAHRGTVWAMNARLVHFIRLCQIELIILDDFQHLIDGDTARVLHTVSDWLKVLIKKTRIPFLVVGLEGQVCKVLNTNPQLSRLFRRETLTPFNWDARDAASVREFDRLIASVEHIVGLPLATSVERLHLLHRLHYATDGVMGHVINLLGQAALHASERRAKAVDLPALALAYTELLAQHFPRKANPFLQIQTRT